METPRLLIRSLSIHDAEFIRELVNTENWIRFIGDRQVTDETRALEYVQQILNNPDVTYWTIIQKSNTSPIGVVTYIQKDYLPEPDIGFAFLPAYEGMGFAYEATRAVLEKLYESSEHRIVYAVTAAENLRSIRLLEKLGFAAHHRPSGHNTIDPIYVLKLDEGSEFLATP